MPAPSSSSSSVGPSGLNDRFLITAFFISGATGLAFETVWTRLLGLVFGATAMAVASVLAAYMAGLGLGGLLGGRWAERATRPLLIYGLLEGAIALCSLAIPTAVPALTPLYRALYLSFAPRFLTFSLLRFATLFFVLVIPTTLMGATLPLLVRAVEGSGRATVGASRLYAANTAGAVLGTLLTGFILLPRFGTAHTNAAAVGVGLLLSLGVMLAARRLPSPLAAAPTAIAEARPRTRGASLALVAFGLSGMAAMIEEVGWTRGLVMGLGPSTYAFSVMLAAFLFGIAAGGALGARAVARIERATIWLGLVQVLAAATTLLALNGFEPLLFIYRLASGDSPGGRGPLALGAKAALSGALLVPTALCFGASFPLATAAYGEEDPRLAARVGELYGANTLGCIIGSLAAGFYLVPRWGIEPALVAAAVICLASGAALFATGAGLSGPLRAAGVGSLLLLALSMLLRPPHWDPTLLATNARRLDSAAGQTIFSKPGLTATISVTLHTAVPPVHVALRTDGKADASDFADLTTQVQLGLVTLLFHPAPRDALVVGFASGTTCGTMLKYPGLRSLDVLEIEPAMIEASHFFDHMNGRPLEDPRTHLVETDARNFYRATDRTYDVIVSEPSNPWMAGPSHLFTKEAFTEARHLLRPGGVLGQWIQGYALSPETMGSIVRSLTEVFPHVRAVTTADDADVLFLASDAPLPLDLRTLDQRLAPVRVEARRGGLNDAWDLAAEAIGDDQSLRAQAVGAALNSDDQNFVEFHAPLDFEAGGKGVAWLAAGYPGPYADLVAQGYSADEIGGHVAFRLAEDIDPLMEKQLDAFLLQAGDPTERELLEALWGWRAPRVPPATPWQQLTEQTRCWLQGCRSPPPAPAQKLDPREDDFAALVQGRLPADPHPVAPDLGALEVAARSLGGDCAPLDALPRALTALPAPDEPSWAMAFRSAQTRAVGEAFARCGRTAEARVWETAADAQERSLMQVFVDRDPPDLDAARTLDPTSVPLLRALEHTRCGELSPEDETRLLTELVRREGRWSTDAARLAYLARGQANGAARSALDAALPYALASQPRELSTCP